MPRVPRTIFRTFIRLPGMDAAAGLPPPAHRTMPGNATRFSEVVARERSRLSNFIRGQVRNAADAEDILQDVLLELYAATDAVEQAGAWLFRVARNRIIDRARRRKEEPLPTADEDDGRSWLEENLPDPAAGPDAAHARSGCSGGFRRHNGVDARGDVGPGDGDGTTKPLPRQANCGACRRGTLVARSDVPLIHAGAIPCKRN